MSAAMKRWFGGCLMAATVAVGCGESRLIDDVNDGPTRIAFRPALFRGEVPCRRGSPGALQSYVVNLHQAGDLLEPNDAGLPLPPGLTSVPVACDRSVLFTVVPGRYYKALISGFDRPVTVEEAASIEPRWSSTCGVLEGDQAAPDAGLDPNGPTLAVLYQTVPMTGCTPFAIGSNEASARLVVDQVGALGELRCGSGPGEVSRLEAVLDGTRISAACGSELAFVLQGPAEFHTIELTGFEAVAGPGESDAGALDASTPDPADAGSDADAAALPATGDGGADAGDAGSPPGTGVSGVPPSDAGATSDVPRWRSQCVGQSLPGVTSSATCDPLAPLAAGN
jgi:hypothetical protein